MQWDTLTLEALKKLETKLLGDLEAVRRTLALAQQSQTPLNEVLSGLISRNQATETPLVQVSQAARNQPPSPLKVAGLTRQAVTELDGSFGIGDVKAQLKMHSQRTFGDVAIRQQLKKMEQEGELVMTFQGLGRAGNQYAKTSRFLPSPLY